MTVRSKAMLRLGRIDARVGRWFIPTGGFVFWRGSSRQRRFLGWSFNHDPPPAVFDLYSCRSMLALP
jgi:hypothetical protein